MIVVVGDILVDIFLLSSLRQAEQGDGIVLRGGGSAANTAAWIAHLGEAATLVGCVGADPSGDMLTRELLDGGVRSAVRTVRNRETGAVAVTVGDDGERSMRSARGANQDLAPTDIESIATQVHASHVHLTGYGLLGPYGLDILCVAGQLADRLSARLSFDPSSEGVIHHFGPRELLRSMKSAKVQVLLPNQAEAAALTGLKDPLAAAGHLAQWITTVVVKCGSDGAVAVAGPTALRSPTEPLAAVDTTGAGDAFNAGLLVGLVRDDSIATACFLGHHAAAQVIVRYGGRPPPAGA